MPVWVRNIHISFTSFSYQRFHLDPSPLYRLSFLTTTTSTSQTSPTSTNSHCLSTSEIATIRKNGDLERGGQGKGESTCSMSHLCHTDGGPHAQLFAGVLATSDVKVDCEALAAFMGEGTYVSRVL